MQQEQNSARNVQDSAKVLSCDERIGKSECKEIYLSYRSDKEEQNESDKKNNDIGNAGDVFAFYICN